MLLLQNGALAVHEELMASPQWAAPPSSGAAAAAAAAARRPQFLLGSTTHGAWRRAPFWVEWHKGETVFGRPLGSGGGSGSSSVPAAAGGAAGAADSEPTDDRADEVLRALRSPALAPLAIDAACGAEELHQRLLQKLVINACVNPLTALLHCRNGGLLAGGADAPARALMAELAAECVAALAADGSDDGAGLRGGVDEHARRVEAVVAATAGNANSMLQDVVAGRATEIDYINGFVARRAAARGRAAPLNALLARLVRAREAVPAGLRTHEELR